MLSTRFPYFNISCKDRLTILKTLMKLVVRNFGTVVKYTQLNNFWALSVVWMNEIRCFGERANLRNVVKCISSRRWMMSKITDVSSVLLVYSYFRLLQTWNKPDFRTGTMSVTKSCLKACTMLPGKYHLLLCKLWPVVSVLYTWVAHDSVHWSLRGVRIPEQKKCIGRQ
jgi:hypothetical protein